MNMKAEFKNPKYFAITPPPLKYSVKTSVCSNSVTALLYAGMWLSMLLPSHCGFGCGLANCSILHNLQQTVPFLKKCVFSALDHKNVFVSLWPEMNWSKYCDVVWGIELLPEVLRRRHRKWSQWGVVFRLKFSLFSCLKIGQLFSTSHNSPQIILAALLTVGLQFFGFFCSKPWGILDTTSHDITVY